MMTVPEPAVRPITGDYPQTTLGGAVDISRDSRQGVGSVPKASSVGAGGVGDQEENAGLGKGREARAWRGN